MIKSTRGTSIDTVIWDRKAVKPVLLTTDVIQPLRKSILPKSREFNEMVSDIETVLVKKQILYYTENITSFVILPMFVGRFPSTYSMIIFSQIAGF